MKLSIIIPVYNAELYLEACMKSLLSQTFRDFEIILADDGSTDESAVLCRMYEKNYNNVRYVYQENKGPSAARNRGLSMAKGYYIGFCDSDDYVDPDMYSLLIERMESQHTEMAMCDFYSERDSAVGGIPWNDGILLDRKRILNELIPEMVGTLIDFSPNTPLWGSVWRSIFLNKNIDRQQIRFKEGIHFAEDLMFTLDYLRSTNSLSIVNYPLYHYTCNPNSLMNTHIQYKPEMFETRLEVLKHLEIVLDDLNIYKQNEKRLMISARAYAYEAVGNACREMKYRGIKMVWREIQKIIHNDIVEKAFQSYRLKLNKMGLMYFAIKYKMSAIPLLYYLVRFRGK